MNSVPADLTRPTLTVCVDPGKSVGVAALFNSNRYRVHQVRLDQPGGRELLDAHLDELFTIATARDYKLLVGCEQFIVNRRTARLSQQNDATQVIGRVQAMSPVDVEMQTAANAGSFVSNARLRQLGLWVTPADVGQPDADDANSAMRHAILLLARKSARNYQQLVYRAS